MTQRRFELVKHDLKKRALRNIKLQDKRVSKLFEDFLLNLEARLDNGKEDRNIICRDTLVELYFGKNSNYEEILNDTKCPLASKTLIASFDPRNITLEP